MPSPMHGKGPSVQKPKDFKGSLKKIVRILAPYKFSFILGLITAVISVVISVVGPKIMGNIITEIANGFMAKVQGTGGIDFDKIFAENDVIVGPTTTEPAFGIGEEVSDPIKMYNNDILTISANLAGIPAASVPAGLVDGMPVGLQVMAKRFDEGNVFKTADFIERTNKFYEKTPTGMED